MTIIRTTTASILENVMPECSYLFSSRLARTQRLMYAFVFFSGLRIIWNVLHNIVDNSHTSRRSSSIEMITDNDIRYHGSTFFVPSINYAHDQGLGPKEVEEDKKLFADYGYPDCEHPPKSAEWHWSLYGTNYKNINSTTFTNTTILLEENAIPITTQQDKPLQQQQQIRKATRRLLIGLYAGFDKYAELLQLTARINKAYAKYWNHDLVVLQGTPASTQKCTGRSFSGDPFVTLNKLRLLFHGIENNNEYDQILLLDSDAMLYDFDFDVTSLLPDDDITNTYMVAASRSSSCSKEYCSDRKVSNTTDSWNVHSNILLWNLRHHLTREVAVDWFLTTRQAILNQKQGNFLGGEVYLQEVLQRQLEQERQEQEQDSKYRRRKSTRIVSLENEFAYGNGTVIRHFLSGSSSSNRSSSRHGTRNGKKSNQIAENFEKQKQRISEEIQMICKRYHPICDAIEETIYPSE